jgi:hypothetical protein
MPSTFQSLLVNYMEVGFVLNVIQLLLIVICVGLLWRYASAVRQIKTITQFWLDR